MALSLGRRYDSADATCRTLANRHYENFSVTSILTPRPLRIHLARLYAYARTTDDLGDETGRDASFLLNDWREQVRAMFSGEPAGHPVLVALSRTVGTFSLPEQPFLDLIAANLQDQAVSSYPTWDDLFGYCMLSAAPVGRVVLRLFGVWTPQTEALSDDVCIGLQLANFAQDVAVDRSKGRTYLVGSELEHGMEFAVRSMVERAATLLASGRDLEAIVPPRFAMQLALYRMGGEAIIRAIRQAGYRTDSVRPTVSTTTKIELVGRVPAQRLTLSNRRRDSERFCRQMARREAANFYWGFLALPRAKRIAIYALYDFARQVDDEVDGATPQKLARRLDQHRDRLRRGVASHTDDPVMNVLARAMVEYHIPLSELEELVLGVERDYSCTRYATWEELRSYCRLVASSVGRMCVRIFGFSDPSALARADELGQAMQLTNILRDVREDAGMDRIYLPLQELARFNISEDALLSGRPGPGWSSFVTFQVRRARGLFASGLRVTQSIPRTSAICVRTMAGIYEKLLDEIEANPEIPLQRRASLSPLHKLGVAAHAWLVPR